MALTKVGASAAVTDDGGTATVVFTADSGNFATGDVAVIFGLNWGPWIPSDDGWSDICFWNCNAASDSPYVVCGVKTLSAGDAGSSTYNASIGSLVGAAADWILAPGIMVRGGSPDTVVAAAHSPTDNTENSHGDTTTTGATPRTGTLASHTAPSEDALLELIVLGFGAGTGSAGAASITSSTDAFTSLGTAEKVFSGTAFNFTRNYYLIDGAAGEGEVQYSVSWTPGDVTVTGFAARITIPFALTATDREVNPDTSYYYNRRTVGFEHLPHDLNSLVL